MTKTQKTLLLPLLLAAPLQASSLLSDNFNAPDSANFDTSEKVLRQSGALWDTVQLRSARIQHSILSGTVRLARNDGSGNLRFSRVSPLPVALFDFASGTTGSTILAEGGVRVAFDFIPVENTSANWLSFCAGISAADVTQRVNEANTDFGILFRNNGGVQHFNNGAATTPATTFNVSTVRPHRVVIEFSISSFADAGNGVSDVRVSAWVDGTQMVSSVPFNLQGNAGTFYMELGANIAGTRVDNLFISGLNGVACSLPEREFRTSAVQGTLISTLVPELSSTVPAGEALTYSLISGTGDTDNAKFQITGDRLEAGAFSFSGEPDATIYSVRVRATGSISGKVSEEVFQIRIRADADVDGLLDPWELAKAGNLTDLNGLASGPGPGAGTGDFDGDGLSDLQEFNLRNTYDLNPTLADTDADGLSDFAELNPVAPRTATNPAMADTDSDGLGDVVETGTGTFVTATDTGTKGSDYDSDDDLFPDGYEVERGSQPNDVLSTPGLPPAFTATVLTTDEDSGISTSKIYTHKISGGSEVTVNGVTFNALRPGVIPANFTWTTTTAAGAAGTFNEVNNNLNGWDTTLGGVSGAGLIQLLTGFSYAGNGDTPGAVQRFTLNNLFVGQPYVAKLYIRPWAKAAGSGRPIRLTFTNGAEIASAYVLEDRPGAMNGSGNADSAWVLSFPFTAQATSMVIQAAVPATTISPSGSLHLYGLSNEIVGPNLADSDNDGLLDSWEQLKAGNTTDLNGLAAGPGPGAGTGDFDGDGLSDLQEYELRATYDLNPKSADTDGDTLPDGGELTGVGLRSPTNPARADTDNDGLSDLAETATGVFVSASDTGTNPVTADTDGDLFPDGLEISSGTDPHSLTSVPALPAGFTAVAITTDESSGISASKLYTHKFSGGLGATINGVTLAAHGPAAQAPGVTWTATLPNGNPGTLSQIVPANAGEWDAVAGGVTGTGIQEMLGTFTYSTDGANPGSYQTWTLSGLTSGQKYDLRLYVRVWDIDGTFGRPLQLTLTNGAEVRSCYLLEDRPGVVLANDNIHSAYYLSIPYTAQGTDVVLTAAVPLTTGAASGSFHLYGLTNESVPDADFAIADIQYQETPLRMVTLTCRTVPGATYAVDYSTDLKPQGQPGGWIQLAAGIASGGATTTYQDTTIVGMAPRIFYRFRKTSP